MTALGLLLLIAGALAGWGVSRIHLPLALFSELKTPLTHTGLDLSGYLGADITAQAVIIAVVIGFNATTLQIAGQTHSLALVRVILVSMTPFLLCWCATTGIALLYFILPPTCVGQAWQLLFWFAAVVVLMIAYLWELPWRLSGQYIAYWAIRALRRVALADWESQDAYSALQTAVSAASVRGDIGTLRSITLALGDFLIYPRDIAAEAHPEFDGARYRALKNLLAGCSQHVSDAPNAVAYHLGFIQAGIMLQAAAIGLTFTDPNHDLFSGVLREMRKQPERINPLWTGIRHALLRGTDHDDPYLLIYWRRRGGWTADDPRRTKSIAEGLAALYISFWSVLRATGQNAAETSLSLMLDDLYRYISVYLGKRMLHDRPRIGKARTSDLPLVLLDGTHAAVMREWLPGVEENERISAINSYERYRSQLAEILRPAFS